MGTECGLFEIFCPCSEPIQTLTTKESNNYSGQLSNSIELPQTLSDPYTFHPIHLLNFCSNCNQIKCRRCIEPEIILKFCPNCMEESSPESDNHCCSKNCMVCPICDSPIIFQEILRKNRFEGSDTDRKTQLLCCTSCTYTYKITRREGWNPLTPLKLIYSELTKKDPDIERFSSLEKYHIANLQEMLPHERPELTRSWRNKVMLSESSIVQGLEGFSEEKSNLVPIMKYLSTRSSKRCKACREIIMKPEAHSKSVRFYKLSNAYDHLPTIKLFKVKDNYVLLLKSLNDKDTCITLTSLDENLFFPIPKTRIPGKNPDKSFKGFLKGVSLLEINSWNSKTGRVERMSRNALEINDSSNIVEKGEGFVAIPVRFENIDSNNEKTDFSINKKDLTDSGSVGDFDEIKYDNKIDRRGMYLFFVSVSRNDEIESGYFMKCVLN